MKNWSGVLRTSGWLSRDPVLNPFKNLQGDLKISVNDPRPTWQSWGKEHQKIHRFWRLEAVTTARGASAQHWVGTLTPAHYFCSYFRYKSAERKTRFKKRKENNSEKLPVHSRAGITSMSSSAINGGFYLFPASHHVPRDAPGIFPHKSLYHLLKRRGRLLVSTANKQCCSHVFFVCIVPSKYISESRFTGMMLFFFFWH